MSTAVGIVAPVYVAPSIIFSTITDKCGVSKYKSRAGFNFVYRNTLDNYCHRREFVRQYLRYVGVNLEHQKGLVIEYVTATNTNRKSCPFSKCRIIHVHTDLLFNQVMYSGQQESSEA